MKQDNGSGFQFPTASSQFSDRLQENKNPRRRLLSLSRSNSTAIHTFFLLAPTRDRRQNSPPPASNSPPGSSLLSDSCRSEVLPTGGPSCRFPVHRLPPPPSLRPANLLLRQPVPHLALAAEKSSGRQLLLCSRFSYTGDNENLLRWLSSLPLVRVHPLCFFEV